MIVLNELQRVTTYFTFVRDKLGCEYGRSRPLGRAIRRAQKD